MSASTDRIEGIRHSYGYDALNRLTSDTRSNRTSTTWTYDAADNLTTQADSGTGITRTFSYDPTNSELTGLQTGGSSGQSLSFGYNPNGDRTSTSMGASPIAYGYNQADELTRYQSGSTSATYSYNGDGLRAAKTVTGGSTEGYVWDIAEGMPTIIQDGSTRYITGPSGLPIEQVDGSGTIEYYIQDQLGSTRGLLDSAGTLVGSYTFTPYGELKGHSGASTPFGYAGQYSDSESGLQYLRARYYDPQSAQFLTVDPLVGSTMEPYGYAGQNPLNALDPSGLWCFSINCLKGAAGSALGTVAVAARHGVPWVYQHCGIISAVSGAAAMITLPVPVASASFGAVSAGAGLCASIYDAQRHHYGAATIDIVGAVAGIESIRYLRRAQGFERLAEAGSHEFSAAAARLDAQGVVNGLRKHIVNAAAAQGYGAASDYETSAAGLLAASGWIEATREEGAAGCPS